MRLVQSIKGTWWETDEFKETFSFELSHFDEQNFGGKKFLWDSTQSLKKKNVILPFAAMRMNLENIILCEINQTEKDKYCMT